jgi:16S rRNA (guanine527-N7)-methyltransferase
VTRAEVRERLLARLTHAGVIVSPAAVEPLENYFWLLARWNPKVNLTALPLDPPRDETFDRLFVEPVVAADRIKPATNASSPMPIWFDLGSGGGSPAIPLKIMRPYWALTMIESKERKAAFLREAIRALRLRDSQVANVRFEELGAETLSPGTPATARADLITVRAVKLDGELATSIERLLSPAGLVAVFGSGDAVLPGFSVVDSRSLLPTGSAVLTVLSVPRGTS